MAEELDMAVVIGDDDTVRVTLAGRFDVGEAPRVRETVLAAPVAGIPRMVIDLSGVSFLDSAGLAVLARARRDRVLSGRSLVLVRPASDDAMRVFRLTRFDEIFTMVDQGEES